MSRVKDLTGLKFGRLEVKEFHSLDDKYQARWLCKCDCGNLKIAMGCHLTRGSTTSCGCYAKESQSQRQTNYFKGNETCLTDGVVRVKFSNCDDYFTCDPADWENAKHLTWSKTSHGYVRNSKRDGEIRFQNFIMNPPSGMIVDHIDGNKLNNCRSNLRIVTPLINLQNRHTTKGKTGVIGVRQFPNGKYGAQVKHNGKTYYLGRFETLEEAANARMKKAIELNHGGIAEYVKGEI